jgi:hypothetical protein
VIIFSLIVMTWLSSLMAFSTLGGQIVTAKHITFGQEMILALDHITHVDVV